MTEIEKVDSILLNINDRISTIDTEEDINEKIIFINDCLMDFAVLLKYILMENKIESIHYNRIVQTIDFQMSRLFEVCDIDPEEFKRILRSQGC